MKFNIAKVRQKENIDNSKFTQNTVKKKKKKDSSLSEVL